MAIDGKAIRGSKGQGKQAVHLVSAWSNQLGLVMGQERVDQKSNEITALPKLLKALEIKGCLITLETMGCQKKVAEEYVRQEADYVLAVKGNQKTLYKDIAALLEKEEKRLIRRESYDRPWT